MKEIVRFYEIAPNSTDTIRAWQGHKGEKKWLYCHSGSFVVYLIGLSNFINPPEDVEPFKFELDSNNPAVLEVPGGFATGFKANQSSSKLLVFSNFTLEQSKQDDFRYPVTQWPIKW